MLSAPKVSTETVLSVLDRAENGPVVDEEKWDRFYIYQTIKDLVERYDIRWEHQKAGVPADDDLADRLFSAGMELASHSGVYCIDTHRRMTWSPAELQSVLDNAPAEITVGEGVDVAHLHHRRPEEDSRVAVIGGAYGILVPEALFVPMMVSYAQ
ncbi:MAG: monomethylamine:corrinoid methyltransferase, partial [Anaerolineales bacterium]|nr:monomethylamine:corrinoid methyltransferase [Anaerolineales bacterium]